jgi:anti-sigma factor RsiW
VLSGALAAGVAMVLLRDDRNQRIAGDVVSAHLRSLQGDHLMDVQSSDQHTVKPWFNGRLDVAPPVIDLTAQGFTLIGGRLDYIDGKPVGVLVYKRRAHVINLFVVQTSLAGRFAAHAETIRGFNIRRWSSGGLEFWAVSDINSDELQEFEQKFQAAA